MFVINPDPYSLPCYRIGPFQTKDLVINHLLPDSDRIDEYFDNRFSNRDYIYTENGRKAINLALSQLNLEKDDVVTILTTSGNFYISGCVTAEIEKFCKWSREILPGTKVIFVNHEFGFPYPGLKELKEYNLPIIEDLANTFFSKDKHGETGLVGDYIIYSFPKIFPLQVGGLLVANDLNNVRKEYKVDEELLRHIKNVLSKYIGSEKEIVTKRVENYNFLKEKFAELGFEERFKVAEGTIPGVFMFKTEDRNIDLPELKKHFYAHGVQCSVFYGEEAFFIPVHQALAKEDMDYFVEVMRSFMKKQ